MKPSLAEVEPLVRALYARNPVGCCLHIVLDDGNVSHGSVRFCLFYAGEQGHEDCLNLAALLLRMRGQ